MSDDFIISEIEKGYILSLLEKGKRADRRELDEHRPIKIELGYIEKAEGSALVSIGNTKILVGIKAEIGTPYPDSPDSGVITTTAELSPVAAPFYESGPPRDDATILARVTDRAIRESHCVDLSKLCIVPGKLVWIIFIDMYVLNYDGSLFDAATLGAIASLATTKLPKVELKDDDGYEILDETNELPIVHYPITVTNYKIGDYTIIDPNMKEERISEAYLVLAFDEKDHIVAAQKGNTGVFKRSEIMPMVRKAFTRSKDLRNQLMSAISEYKNQKEV